jgi:hypothetical protein
MPWFYEAGLVSDGDPALAFGPRPGADGTFAWSNGSRLYYATLAANFSAERSERSFKGFEAVAVSRTDDVSAAAAGAKSAWQLPVIVSKQNASLFSDKEAIWVDNAELSPFFGNVYLCHVAFRGTEEGTQSEPVMLARSTDGGDTWTTRQLSSAANTGRAVGRSGGRQGCAIRTDSAGNVYVFWSGALDGRDVQYMARSVDGGRRFGVAVPVATLTVCGARDVVQNDLTFDGVAGARTNSYPSVDIANGAPTGSGAPDTLVMAWCDGGAGLDHERALVQTSSDGGATWSALVDATQPGDRPDFPAIAIAPDGSDLYLVYMAFLDPWRTSTADPRQMQGVVRHADAAGGAWTTLHRGTLGDARGSSANTLTSEFLGDYTGIVASNGYAAAVWTDVRDAAVCPAVDAFRQTLADGAAGPRPAPGTDCPATFGNSDIVGGAFADPTP